MQNTEESIRKIVEEYEEKIKQLINMDHNVFHENKGDDKTGSLLKRITQLENEKKSLARKLVNIQKLEALREKQNLLNKNMSHILNDKKIKD